MLKAAAPKARLFVFFSSFLVLLVGVLLLRRGSITFGLLVTAIGLIAYLWSSAQLQKQSPSEDEMRAIKAPSITGVFIFLSVACAVAVIFFITDPQPTPLLDRLASLFWILSMLFIVISAFWASRGQFKRWGELKSGWVSHRAEILTVAGIVLVALLARTVYLSSHPYPWSGDEASVGSEGRRIINGEVTDFFDSGWSGQPNWSFVPTALTLKIFGQNFVGIRMVSALAGTFTVLFVYLLGREMFNKQVGLLAAAFLALYSFHVHFSRIGVNNINDGFMVALVLWLVFRAVRKGRTFDYVVAGVASGLTIYTYVGTRLVLILALGTLTYILITERGFWRAQIKNLILFGLALAITAAPMTYYFAKHPDIFINRIGQEGIFFNGWLGRHAQDTGLSIPQILGEQISRSTLVFIAHGAPGNFFSSPNPYLTILGTILFLLGMVASFQRIRQRPYLVLLAWFWSVVILGGVLTLNPPSNTRMVMTAPAVALFIGIGIWQVSELLGRLNISSARRAALAVVLILFLAVENELFYFDEYRTNYYFQDANAELAMEAGLQLQELGPNYAFFMLGSPRVFAGFPTIEFLAPNNPKIDPNPDELGSISLKENEGALFVVIPENFDTLNAIAQQFPNGHLVEVPRIATMNEMLYYAYIVPPR